MEVIGFIVWVVLCFVVYSLANTKGRSGCAWFFISLLLSPLIGLIILLCVGDSDEKKEENINAAWDVIKQRNQENERLNTNDDSQTKAIEDLKKYKDLLELGAISQEEFDAKKEELMPLLRQDFKEQALPENIEVEEQVEISSPEPVVITEPTPVTKPEPQSSSRFSRSDYVLGAVVLAAALLVGFVVWANFRDTSKKPTREVVKEANLQVASIHLQDFYKDLVEIKNDPGFREGKNKSFKRYKSWQKELRKFDELNKGLFDNQRVSPSKLLELGAEFYYTKGAENSTTRLLCSTFNDELPRLIKPQVAISPQTASSATTGKITSSQEDKVVLSAKEKKVIDQYISFYRELLKFKNEPDFKYYGFGRGGKYYEWMERVRQFNTDANGKILMKVYLVPADIELLASEYAMSQGEETEATQLLRPSLDESIRDYKKMK